MPGEVTGGGVEHQTFSVGIGTRMQFQLGMKGQEFKAAGILVGMMPNESLIIRVPPIPGILNRLEAGSSVVVRYVYAGNVYGFTSKILICIQKPALIVFLAYPATVETMNLRKAQRLQCLFPARVKTHDGDYDAVMVDISLGGCRICLDYGAGVPQSADIDQTIEISFHLPGVEQEQVINARIQNLKKDGQVSEMGVKFDPENEAVLNNVKLHIDSFAGVEFLPLVEPPSKQG